jgi:hypothetical protein
MKQFNTKIDFPPHPNPLPPGERERKMNNFNASWCPRGAWGFDVKKFAVLGIVLTFAIILSCGKAEESGKEGKQPSSLVISSVTITPSNPLSSSTLQAEVKPQHAETEYAYRWLVNGEEALHETEITLESEHFSKGDSIVVEVTPYQDEMSGKAIQSDPVLILNTPPAMRSFTIEPSPAHSTDDLTAHLDVVDVDDDYIRIAYQWKKNNEPISGETGETLSHHLFAKGDKISCQATFSEEETEEVTYQSGVITIANSGPTITSRLSGNNMEEYSFSYTVVAEDPDGDPLEFSLNKAPEGMIIDPSTGTITWEASEDQRKGVYEFEAIASDPEGAKAIQPITLTFPDTAS